MTPTLQAHAAAVAARRDVLDRLEVLVVEAERPTDPLVAEILGSSGHLDRYRDDCVARARTLRESLELLRS